MASNFAVVIDDTLYRPSSTSEVILRGGRDQNIITDQCGNTERRTGSSNGVSLEVTGYVTDSERGTNLSKQMFIDDVMAASEIEIVSDLYTGMIRVQQETGLSQATGDHNQDEYGNKKFAFTMTLGEPQSEQ